jgi:hypothetical protein
VPLAHYFLGQRHLGASPVHPQSRSHCFFCPTCADIWARVMVEGARESEVHTNACAKHTNTQTFTHGQPPGSMLPTLHLFLVEAAAGSPLLPENLPAEALEREFQVALNWFERISR